MFDTDYKNNEWYEKMRDFNDAGSQNYIEYIEYKQVGMQVLTQ